MAGDPYGYLLDMNGFSHYVGPEGKGYACMFRAEEKHGKVSYAVVLCDRYGNRILGFDTPMAMTMSTPRRKGSRIDSPPLSI